MRRGAQVRDYVHPSDLAKAHLEALRYLLAGTSAMPRALSVHTSGRAARAVAGNKSDIFNLGTGRGSSVLEVLRAVEVRARHGPG